MQTEPVIPVNNTAVKKIDLSVFLAVGLTIAFWASAFACIRISLRSYTPENVALLRYLTASFALVVYALLAKMPLPARKDIPRIALTGFLGFTFYNVALNAGEQVIPAGTASLMIASTPIFVALLAGKFFNERLKMGAWIGILVSITGVTLISIESKDGLQLSLSALLVLAAAVSMAIYTVAQKPLLKKYSPLQFTTYAIWAGTFFLLVFSPGLVRQIPTASLESTLAVIYMGIFPGVLGYFGWSYVLAHMPASKAGSFLYLTPAVAILIAWLWLGETPAVSAWFGGLLILTGVIIVNLSGKK
jgi:drug/metabolite transporter (DMT)-like permease